MRAIEWDGKRLRFIDQTHLPVEEIYVETDDYRVLCEAIRSLRIRGAPAIGVAAGFGVLLAALAVKPFTAEGVRSAAEAAATELSSTRPTAVNLFRAIDRMRTALHLDRADDPQSLVRRLRDEAVDIMQEDVESCRRIGEFGAQLLQAHSTVLTHCNAGGLATAGNGTALSVITTAARDGKIDCVYVDETRPLLQGARLTTWELLHEGIRVILITDTSAATVLRQGKVSAVLVGADRIAANGDTANKIGTYPLAVVAERHHIPLYVAAPTSTIDFVTRNGEQIPIEERNAAEVTSFGGTRVAPAGVEVFAPAFDVTPAHLITAFITERGIIRPPYETALEAVSDDPAVGRIA
jgi:methylthioribose-1-phosphate isomerase